MVNELETRILEVLENAGDVKLSTDVIRERAGISNWSTCNRFLWKLAYQGKVKAIKTSKKWVFAIEKDGGTK